MRYIQGKVTSTFLQNGNRFLSIEVPDPRYPTSNGKQQIVVMDLDQDQQLGDSIKISWEGE